MGGLFHLLQHRLRFRFGGAGFSGWFDAGVGTVDYMGFSKLIIH